MRQLTVGFSRPRGSIFPIFSWIIRAVECTSYSHVYLAWDSISGARPHYHAAAGSVHFLGSRIAERKLDVRAEFLAPVSEAQYRKLIHFTHSHAGTSYGWKQIVGIGIQKLLRLRRNPLADGRKSWVCSEAVGYVLQDVLGYDLGDLDLDTAGPRAIYEWCEANLPRAGEETVSGE